MVELHRAAVVARVRRVSVGCSRKRGRELSVRSHLFRLTTSKQTNTKCVCVCVKGGRLCWVCVCRGASAGGSLHYRKGKSGPEVPLGGSPNKFGRNPPHRALISTRSGANFDTAEPDFVLSGLVAPRLLPRWSRSWPDVCAPLLGLQADVSDAPRRLREGPLSSWPRAGAQCLCMRECR